MRRSDDRSRDSRRSRDHVDEERSRELERKRREWRIEQEKRREHEKRKQKMIEEWEAKRARELELKKQRRRSKSRSRSASPGASRRRGRSRSGESRRSRVSSNRVPVMSEKSAFKCDSSSTSNTPLFKGSEGSKISVNELKKIKVNIQREISNAEETPELLRDITSPDEIVLKRREGEGSKPIFEREELKTEKSTTVDVPERRTVVAVDKIESGEKRFAARRSRSLSSGRHTSRSSHRASRHDVASKSYTESHRRVDSRDRGDCTTNDRYHARRYASRKSSPERGRDFRSHRSLERDRDSGYRERHDYERLSHHHRRNEADRRSAATLSYAEPMTFPMYYDNLARPIMMDPMVMLRHPLPGLRGRIPPMMTTFRPPYRPRFIPPEMFRHNAPLNQGYGRMFH